MGAILTEDKKHYVEDNLKLVHFCVAKYIKPLPGDYEDVFQEGCIGLIKAAIGFNEALGNKFATYAVPMIIGYCKRYLRDKKPLIKYSRNMIDLYTKISILKSQGLTDNETIKELNIGSSLYFDIMNMNNVASLDEPVNEDDEGSSLSLMDTLGLCSLDTDVEEDVFEENVEKTLETVVKSLGDRYRAIYEEYIYCLFYGEKLSQDYFAKKYGICQAQVSRIIKKLNKVYCVLLQGEDLV